MNCRVKPYSSGSRSRGFTLVEALIMGAVATVVSMAVIIFSIFATRSFLALGNYNDLDKASRNALDRISREIRQTSALYSYATNKLVFIDWDDKTNLVYQWTPPSGNTPGHLDRTKAGVTTVMLNQCDYLNFGISQRNPSNNFNFYPAATNNLATVKLIDLSWRCSRKILQQKVNIESVQTAKIVMRNH
jgi:hypothetical protein